MTSNRPAVPSTFGGVQVFAIMDDGDTLCVKCVEDESNPVHNADGNRDGWGVIGFDTTDGVDDELLCAHCGTVILEGNGA